MKDHISTIYSTGEKPDADATWDAYIKLLKYDYDNGIPVDAIPSHRHQMTLRAIAPSRASYLGKQRDKSANRKRAVQANQSFQEATNDAESKKNCERAEEVYSNRAYRPSRVFDAEKLPLRSEFHRRAFLILDRLALNGNVPRRERAQETPQPASPLPDIKDYHFLLRSAVASKDWPMFSSICDRMAEKGVLFRGSDSASASTLPIATPNADTYQWLFSGYHGLMIAERKNIINRQYAASAGGVAQDKLPQRDLFDALKVKQQHISNSAMSLFRDMVRAHHITPTPRILQTLCVILKMCGQLPQLDLVLQQSYGITVKGLKANPEWVSDHKRPVPITTRILNLILQTLGETATPREMIAVFEALKNPLPTPTQPVVQPAAPGSVFKTEFKTLFRSDPQPDHFTQNNSPQRADPPLDIKRSDPSSLPNTQTFFILLSHCFARPRSWSAQTSGVRQFLIHTDIDVDLMHQSTEEKTRRKIGWYRYLGRYIQSLSLDYYEEQLERVASQLGYSLKREVDPERPTIDDYRDEVLARAQAEATKLAGGRQPPADQPPPISDRHFVSSDPRLLDFPGILTEEGRLGFSLLPPRTRLVFDQASSTLSHTPYFDPPTITPCNLLFTSMFSFTRGMLSPMFFESMTQLRRGLHLLQLELDLMETAQRHVAQRIAKGKEEVNTLLKTQAKEKAVKEQSGQSKTQPASKEKSDAPKPHPASDPKATSSDQASSSSSPYQPDTPSSSTSSSSSLSRITPRSLRLLRELHRHLVAQTKWVKQNIEQLREYEEKYVFPRGERIRQYILTGVQFGEEAQIAEERKEMYMQEEEENRARILAEIKEQGEVRIEPAVRPGRRGPQRGGGGKASKEQAEVDDFESERYPL